jgi:uncharacterized protein with von Willebrand factor type A (vWA) domain
MFLKFFYELKRLKIPISLREFLTFLDTLQHGLADFDVEAFYFLARASLIKHEKNIDKFDRVFSHMFSGVQDISLDDLFNSKHIPNDWIKKLTEKILSQEEKEKLEALGGFEKLMETLRKRLEEQEKRHQGRSY